MDRYRSMAILATVVEQGSIRRAARELRLTPSAVSQQIRRQLADWPLILCASPRYLGRRGTPASPQELAQHDFLALPRWHHGTDVMTGPKGEQCRVDVSPRVLSNNQVAIRDLTLTGLGLSFHVVPEIADDLAAGRLVHVLPDWRLPQVAVAALMPPRTRQPSKVRMAVDALRAHLNPKPPVETDVRAPRPRRQSTR